MEGCRSKGRKSASEQRADHECHKTQQHVKRQPGQLQTVPSQNLLAITLERECARTPMHAALRAVERLTAPTAQTDHLHEQLSRKDNSKLHCAPHKRRKKFEHFSLQVQERDTGYIPTARSTTDISSPMS